MEDLHAWFSIAFQLTHYKDVLAQELQSADKIIRELEQSILTTREELTKILSVNTLESSDLQQYEQNIAHLGRFLYRFRSKMIKIAARHCLKSIKRFKQDILEESLSPDNGNIETFKSSLSKICSKIYSEEHLPRSQGEASLFDSLLDEIKSFPADLRIN